MLPAPPVPK
ncbi:hypothetical protein RDI58_014789 [Solanum bulbocastanum]|uniref:Uncharacterized protein n=1 Tax=Solanum bulbocastanum TaxID=147425 RepID=A0AAN8YAW7_SOLBU